MRTLETDLSIQNMKQFYNENSRNGTDDWQFSQKMFRLIQALLSSPSFFSVSSISRNTRLGHVIQLVQAGVSITPSAANSIVTVRSTTSVFLTLQFCLYLLTSVTLVTLVSRVMSCLNEFLTNLLLFLTWTRTSTFDTNSLLLKTRMRYKLTDKKTKKDMSSTG